MRLPIAIGAVLLISLGLNAPVMAQTPTQIVRATKKAAKSDLQQLKRNSQLWNQQNISNYRYTLTRSCFCTAEARGPVVVEVREGVTTVTSVATGETVDSQLFKQYDTVPNLFNVVKEAIASKASSLTVQYDSKLGYPTQINIDYNSQIADEELYLTIENFQVIP
ncbi:hypothetical protein Cylst_2548 [Cylindrospermum stagnale PCC 7417]|uniref:Beta-lactamase-inhibitor-like PepSY-like domain-containing protein n=1 Tax=Cylindrospermum stagnale PCC 7417 TaxID=56107 RepID=K9WWJ4_9NOST|nr:DUF6174 domain-containing protein [Cylindrospermum stagnale]AFZ24755.1 hypothetical protein Cylst_2548 [Cylindrospermum stagnale PCC 7417]